MQADALTHYTDIVATAKCPKKSQKILNVIARDKRIIELKCSKQKTKWNLFHICYAADGMPSSFNLFPDVYFDSVTSWQIGSVILVRPYLSTTGAKTDIKLQARGNNLIISHVIEVVVYSTLFHVTLKKNDFITF